MVNEKFKAMYRTLHECEPAYQRNNQGLSCYGRWKEVLPFPEGDKPYGSVLEVGCGNGILCEFLGRMGYTVTGLDLVKGPYERKGYSFSLCDVTADNLPTGFDLTLCFDVLEHLPEHSLADVLAELGQTAKKLIATVACYPAGDTHLTVKSPGWWLNTFVGYLGRFEWRLQVWDRYDDRPSSVVLFMGEQN